MVYELQVLAISRIMVAWQPVGIAAGVYDMCVRYTKERQQFSRSLASFQLQQERLARMAGSIQVCIAQCTHSYIYWWLDS